MARAARLERTEAEVEAPHRGSRGREKRRSQRAPVVVRVDYSTVDSFFSDFTRNINEGGLFIETDEPCAVDEVVNLQFQLPGGDAPVRVRGRVVWVDAGEAPGMGIEFEELDPPTRARINQVVRRLRAHPGKAGQGSEGGQGGPGATRSGS